MTGGRGDDTRRSLLDATVEVILERGWGGVTTRAVAERAGVPPGLVHYHFDSVDELRREAAVSTLSSHLDPFVDLATQLTPVALIEAAALATAEEYAPGTDVARLIYEVMPAATRDVHIQQALADLLVRFRTALEASIRRDHPRPLAPPDVIAGVVAAALDGLQFHLLADPTLDVSAHMRALVHLLGPASTDHPHEEHP